MKIFYFTASGNSLHVAKSLGGELISIPKALKEGNLNFVDNKIGFVFPVHNIMIPPLVIDFLKKATFKSDYLFAIATYGTFKGIISKQLKDIALKRNMSFSYINGVRMVDNYGSIVKLGF